MAETGGASPGEIGGVVAGAIAVLGVLGGGVRYLVGVINARGDTRASRNAEWERDLDAREREMERKLAESLRQCEAHCAVMQVKLDKTVMAVLLLLPEVTRAVPESPAIRQVRELLADVIPDKIEIPADMAAQLAAIDEKTA